MKIEFTVPHLYHRISDEQQEIILEIFKNYNLANVYHPKKEIKLEQYVIYDTEKSILNNHKLWNSIETIETPPSLPRLESDYKDINKLFQLSIQYIDNESGGMSSFFGFNGYYLSLILDLENKTIIDARGQTAS